MVRLGTRDAAASSSMVKALVEGSSVMSGGERLRRRRPGETHDGAQRRAELPREGARIVRNAVARAKRPHARRRFGIAIARQIGEEVVLDLVAQVSAEHVEQRTALDVARA